MYTPIEVHAISLLQGTETGKQEEHFMEIIRRVKQLRTSGNTTISGRKLKRAKAVQCAVITYDLEQLMFEQASFLGTGEGAKSQKPKRAQDITEISLIRSRHDHVSVHMPHGICSVLTRDRMRKLARLRAT